MPLCWLYTGSTLEEAETKANTAIGLVNEECNRRTNANWVDGPQRLTADPNIEGTVYYYMFQAPPAIFQNGALYDLEAEFNTDWLIPEI